MLLALPISVYAEDDVARYNFASAQGDKELKISPGEEGRGDIYFYNIDGNRITHITLVVSRAPSDWDISIEPPLSEVQVLVSGVPVTVEENLYVEPSELLPEEPRDIPEGMVSIKVPGRGYTLGKLAQMIVRVPESTPLGSTTEITIAGEAAWLGQGGSAAIKQARDFNFTVTVVSGSTEYTETIVERGAVPETPEIPRATSEIAVHTPEGEAGQPGKEIQPAIPEGVSPDSSLTKWLPAIIAGAVVILGVIVTLTLVARKRR